MIKFEMQSLREIKYGHEPPPLMLRVKSFISKERVKLILAHHALSSHGHCEE